MFIPMGTVVTVCMLLTVLFANRLPVIGFNRIAPPTLLRVVGVITGAAGLWNVLWYALRHLGELWGYMALGSGVLMFGLSALLVLPATRQPAWMQTLRPYAIAALLGFALCYAYTIYNL